MATEEGPWTKYQKAQEGPWTKYQKTEQKPPELAQDGEGFMSSDPGQVHRAALEALYEAPVPGLAAAKGLMQKGGQALSDVGSYVSEKLGKAGVPDPISASIGAIPGIPGEIYKSASGLIPAKMGDVAVQAMTEGAGPIVEGLGAKFLPPLEKRAPNIVRAVKSALSADILPSMAQITQSPFIAGLEETASKMPFIGKRIQAMRHAENAGYDALRSNAIESAGPEVAGLGEKTQADVRNFIERGIADRERQLSSLHKETLAKFGPSVETEKLGQQLESLRVTRTELARKEAGKFYEDLEGMIPPDKNKVLDTNLKASADKLVEGMKGIDPANRSPLHGYLDGLRRGPGNHVVEVAIDPLQKPATLLEKGTPYGVTKESVQKLSTRNAYTFGEMQTLRSDIVSRIEQERVLAGRGPISNEGRMLGNLLKSLDQDIAYFSESLPGDLKGAKEVADAHWKSYKTDYANKSVKSMGRVAHDNPEKVYGMMVEPGNVSDIRRLKTVVGEASFQPVRRKFVEGLVTDPKTGQMFAGPQIAKNMSNYSPEALREILTPSQLKDLGRAIKTRQMPQFIESEVENILRKKILEKGAGALPPEDVVRRVIDGDSLLTGALRNVVGEKGMLPYKRSVVESIIGSPAPEAALANATGAAAPTARSISRALKEYDPRVLRSLGFGESELAEIAKIEEIKALRESTRALQAQGSGTASSMMAMKAGAGYGLFNTLMHPIASGAFVLANPLAAAGAVATTVIAPDILSRFYVSKMGRQLLIDGMNPAFAKNAQVFARISAFALNAKREKANEDAKKQGLSPAFTDLK